MKFTLLKDLKQDVLMKPILSGLLIFTLLYIVSDIFVKQATIGIILSDISNNLFGNEDEFLDPMLLSSFLEFWHIEIFFIMMVLFTLSAIFIRLSTMNTTNMLILNITLLSALASLICFALSYFVSKEFLFIYIAGFYTWHILSFYMAITSLWKLHK